MYYGEYTKAVTPLLNFLHHLTKRSVLMKHFSKAFAVCALLFSTLYSAEWQSGVFYSVGEEITYQSQAYECQSSHMAQANWYPGAPGIWFWEEIEGGNSGNVGDWDIGTSFSVGDEVIYEDEWYECVYAHASQESWYPGAPGIWFWEKIADSDGDGVPDIVEDEAGTDPDDYDSKPAVLVSGCWANRTASGAQYQEYDFSHFEGYSKCNRVPVMLPIGSVQGEFSLVYTAVQMDRSFVVNNYSVDNGKMIEIRNNGVCVRCLEVGFPVSDINRGVPYPGIKLFHYDENLSEWVEVAITSATYSTVYARIPSTGKYAVGIRGGAYLVSKNFTDDDLNDVNDPDDIKSRSIYEAFAKIEASPNANGDLVFVAKGDYLPSEGNNPIPSLSVPGKTTFCGGFKGRFDGETSVDLTMADSKQYKTTLVAETKEYPIVSLYNNLCGVNFETVIDGFIFQGINNNELIVTNVGGLQIANNYNSGNARIWVKNCVFKENRGIMAGAVFLFNTSKVFFDNCSFLDNVSVAEYITPPTYQNCDCNTGVCRTSIYETSASAVCIGQVSSCGVEAEFYSCVFSGNEAKKGNATYTGTIATAGTSPGATRAVKVVNCTFYDNTVEGTNSAHSIYNGAVYNKDDGQGGTVETPSPVVVLNSILWNNATGSLNKEVFGITTGDVKYTVFNDTYSKDITEKGISYSVINDATIGAVATNEKADPLFEISADIDGPDDIYGTGDDGLRLSINSPARGIASPTGLQEYSGVSVASNTVNIEPYFRASFSDVARRTRVNKNIDDAGAYEKHLRIMCIGDDLTLGNSYDGSSRATYTFSYRAELKRLLKGDDVEVDYVGSNDAPPSGSWGSGATNVNRNHLGSLGRDCVYSAGKSMPGWDVESMGYALKTTTFIKTKVTASEVVKRNPEIVLIMAGSYECWLAIFGGDLPEDLDYTGMNTNIQSMVDIVANNLPDKSSKRIYVGNLPPQVGINYSDAVINFNSQLSLTNIDGGVVDIHSGSYVIADHEGDYKLKRTGYEKMAARWANRIKADFLQ